MIVYDTGALIAGERAARPMWALHDALLRDGGSPLVPTTVLAQAWRGGPQVNLSRLIKGCTIVPLDDALARAAGSLLGRTGTSDIVDASVVALAGGLGAAVVTGDLGDLRPLAAAGGFDLRMHSV